MAWKKYNEERKGFDPKEHRIEMRKLKMSMFKKKKKKAKPMDSVFRYGKRDPLKDI